ncbi:CcdB family protein [Geoalkalibacter halelectricus]|uniref:CcdB family protein n=1 Tax=Geoalkalibacter halelectricus TaxID=2847045 RepID=UPI003D199F42
MAQFDIHAGKGEGVAYLLDLQDDLLGHLATRVVAPLVAPETLGPAMKTVNPRIAVNGVDHILLTHLLAAVPHAALGDPVGTAKMQRAEIVASLDLLFTGI